MEFTFLIDRGEECTHGGGGIRSLGEGRARGQGGRWTPAGLGQHDTCCRNEGVLELLEPCLYISVGGLNSAVGHYSAVGGLYRAVGHCSAVLLYR